jgi:hypothetical protein
MRKMKFYGIDFDCQLNETFFFSILQNKIVLKMHAGDKRSSLIMQMHQWEKWSFMALTMMVSQMKPFSDPCKIRLCWKRMP